MPRRLSPRKKKPKVQIVHKTNGRIRIKIPSAKGHPEILDAYKNVFSAVYGITHIKVKPETGSIIIHYDPKHEHEFEQHFHGCCSEHEVQGIGSRPGDEINELAKKIETEAEFLAEHSQLVRVTVDVFKAADYRIKLATGNTVDLKVVLACGLAAATFIEIGAETATPMWVTLGLFAVNHFIDMNSQQTPVAAAAHHHHHHHHH